MPIPSVSSLQPAPRDPGPSLWQWLRVIAWVLVALVVFAQPLAALAHPGAAFTQGAQCDPADERGIQRCRLGMAPERMRELLRTQKESQWCWAASIQMVFAHVGHELEQEAVVRENFGELLDRPVDVADITKLLNRPWKDRQGRTIQAAAQATTERGGDLRRSTLQVLEEMAAGRPVILGAMRHAVVLGQVEFERFTREEAIRIVGGTVLDPFPGRGVRPLTAADMKAFYVARVRFEANAAVAAAAPAAAPAGGLVGSMR